MQELYPALSKVECEALCTSGASNQKLKELNAKNEKLLQERIGGFIPTSDQYAVKEPLKTLNVVLLGKSGSGKSETGNMIFGDDRFLVSSGALSKTTDIAYETCSIDETTVNIMDTPGTFDSNISTDDIATEIMKV